MKLLAYSVREDEKIYFESYGKKYGMEVIIREDAPSLENAGQMEGCDCVSIITTPVDRELICRWKDAGVRHISTRTVGYDHIDRLAAAEMGITVSNVSYSPYSVADYAVMLILMAVRKVGIIARRYFGQDFTLRGVQGRELRNLTVGVVGTGRIGETVIGHLQGFGCRILAYDLYEKEAVNKMAEYVPLDRLFQEADVITFHAPSTKESHHMVNRETIAGMKDGVILVNTARGSLIDTEALIEGLESGKIGGAALDVLEDEQRIYYQDFKDQNICHRQMAVLANTPGVILTPHTAFFTDQAVSDRVEYSIRSCRQELEGEEDPFRIE